MVPSAGGPGRSDSSVREERRWIQSSACPLSGIGPPVKKQYRPQLRWRHRELVESQVCNLLWQDRLGFVLRIGHRAERDNHVIRGKLWIFPNCTPACSVNRRNEREQATNSRENDGCTIVFPDHMRSRSLLGVGQRIHRVITSFQP